MKTMFRTVAAWIAAAVLFSVQTCAEPAVSAHSAIVMDGLTGHVLFEKNADRRSLIASTTKIMTALLVSEYCDLEDRVIIPQDAVGIEGSSLHLQEGECRSVKELLYGMMLHSGNDAAVALAIHCSGSVNSFVEQMNQKASEIGLMQTNFANPHGLDSNENYATARELAVLASSAMKNPLFRDVVSTQSVSFGDRVYTNHNKLLRMHKGVVGVKTGYTRAAGRILVSAAQRGGRELIVVTINAPDDWSDHCRLLDYGFSHYDENCILSREDSTIFIPSVPGGGYIPIALREDLLFPVMKQEQITTRYVVPLYCQSEFADEAIGKVLVIINGKEAAGIPLYRRND